MTIPFAAGKHAFGFCDVCGFRYKLGELRKLVVKSKLTETLACPQCYEEDQPQLMLGSFPVEDPQALRNPRPDTTYYTNGSDGSGGSRVLEWGWNPVGGARSIDSGLTPNSLSATTAVGTVTIVTT